MREPSVFLLDEPLSNLDAKLRAAARHELKQFQQRIGTTTIYVTHDQAEAMGASDRVAVMDRGRLRQVGSPRDVYADPADTFVATFLGSPPMNLVISGDQIVGFRPECFLPSDVVPGDGNRVVVLFRVTRVEYLSGDRHLYGTIRGVGDEARVISRLAATVTMQVEVGATYDFAVHERDLRFFDTVSGERLTTRPLRSA